MLRQTANMPSSFWLIVSSSDAGLAECGMRNERKTGLRFGAADSSHSVELTTYGFVKRCWFKDTEFLIITHQPPFEFRRESNVHRELEVPFLVRPGSEFLGVVPGTFGD